MSNLSRRGFLLGSGGALAMSTGVLSALQSIVPARAEQAAVTPSMVRMRPEIEPVLRWIEATPRERILDVAVDEMKKGLPYRELLAGVFLAGVRNVKPRPVGFKFHTVLIMNSAHQLALDSPQSERLYPLFWALDHFKDSQEADVRAGDWALGPVDEKGLPSASKAADLFIRSMEKWDAPASDAAVAQLARSAGAADVRERFWPFAARNHRNIGHNIIFAAQAFRTLDTIGWQHSEAVLRSLAFGLLDGEAGEASAAPFEASRALVPSIRKDWVEGKADAGASTAFLETLRHASPEEASKEAAALLGRGVAVTSLWDAILLAGGEHFLRNPGIVALHAVTSMNSMHYAYHASGQDSTRLLLLLQGAAWIALFRGELGARGQRSRTDGPRIEQLEPVSTENTPPVEAIFQEMGKDRTRAARMAFTYARQGGSPEAYMTLGRSLVFRKGSDVHDYKFAAAVFEEFHQISAQWRPYLLAASACHLKPSTADDSSLHTRIQNALRRLS